MIFYLVLLLSFTSCSCLELETLTSVGLMLSKFQNLTFSFFCFLASEDCALMVIIWPMDDDSVC